MTKRKIEIRPTRNSEIDKAVESRIEQRVTQRTEELLEYIATQDEKISDLEKKIIDKDIDIRELQHRLRRARDAMDTRRSRQDPVVELTEEEAHTHTFHEAIDNERRERERLAEDTAQMIDAETGANRQRRRQNTRRIYRG